MLFQPSAFMPRGCMRAFACSVITHGAVADVSMISGSDCRFHVGFLQIAVR